MINNSSQGEVKKGGCKITTEIKTNCLQEEGSLMMPKNFSIEKELHFKNKSAVTF